MQLFFFCASWYIVWLPGILGIMYKNLEDIGLNDALKRGQKES